jgi:AraC-like DNA-binding protein
MNKLRTVLKPEAQKMLGRFSSLLNVRLGFFAPDGTEICIGGGRPVCGYCRLLRANREQDCLALDRRRFARARRAGHPFHYPCHGGLTEAFVPVDLDGRRIGLVMVGQFRATGQAPPPDCSGFAAEYDQRPVFSEEQIEDMLDMLELMVHSITDRHLVTRTEFDLIQPLLDRIHAHPEETLTVQEASALAGRSVSSVAHLFKRLTGRSIRQYQIEHRLDEACRMLKASPDRPVKEIAFRLGFEDPLYFSRLYKKHRGCPPTKFRNFNDV